MKGLHSALSRLGALQERVQRAALGAALEAAEETAKAARAAAPVRTGELRNSISVSSLPNGAKTCAVRPYAAYVENGTGRMPAKPYLLPAAQKSGYARRAAKAFQEALK